ncbi:WG repeat-containing protein [Chryseosolibacter indicus]|uniref:WG repeat-containing protein n=1 Tax=Chryseosolibacter indicus TaxID=2782351 RepID=A0ABS5VRD7_9BACT|nr:WG repeat-containing protein [Chryseosolibacter indicus]MBT1704010.1 WG repeat-containing protein [Chryseosolibacter indicus]
MFIKKELRLPRLFLLVLLPVLLSKCSIKETTTNLNETSTLYPIKENAKWGYMDQTGKVIVPPDFDYAWDFSEGLGRFKRKGKYGFVNAKGEIAIQPSFAYADDFKGEYTRVNTKDTVIYDVFFDGYNLLSNWTFMNKKGVVFSKTFTVAEPVKGGYAAVKNINSYETPYSYVSFVNGELISSERITEAIFSYNGHDLAPALDPNTGKLGLIDKEEQWIVQPVFDELAPLSEGLAAAKKDNLYGYIDTDGNWVYQHVVPVNGNTFYNLQYDFKPFTHGLAAVRFGSDSYGYITKEGKTAFKQQFKSVSSFNAEGYAIVSTEKGTGLIDTKGYFVIKPHLDIQQVEQGLVIYRGADGYGVKDLKTLKDIITPSHTEVSLAGNLIRIREAGATLGYINKDGAFSIAPQFNSAWNFENGKAKVGLNEKIVYIDKTGKVLGDVPIEEQPYYSGNSSALYTWVDEKGKFGFQKSATGELAIPATFDFAANYEGELARVNIGATLNEENYAYYGGKWGLIDATGKAIIAPSYELILPFRKGIALVNAGGDANYTLCEADCDEEIYYSCAGGKWGLLNDKGSLIIEPEYDNIIPFGDNYLVLEGERYGLINAEGSKLYPASLNVSLGEEGSVQTLYDTKYIRAFENGKAGIIDNNGKWILKPQYEDILFSEDSSTPYVEGTVLVRNNNKWGAVNEAGVLLIPIVYDEIRPFSNGLAGIKKNEKWGFINKSNQIVIEPKFYSVRDFQGEVAIVQQTENSGEGVINNKGVFVFHADSTTTIDTDGFKDGLCIIRSIGTAEEAGIVKTSCGVIDSNGKVLFNKNALSDVRIQPNGIIYVVKNNKWAMADGKGAMLTGFDFDWIEPYNGQELIRCNIGGEISYDEYGGSEEFYGGMWGLIDKTGKLRVAMKFAEIGPFNDGLAYARSGEDLDKVGYVDFKGNVIREMKK